MYHMWRTCAHVLAHRKRMRGERSPELSRRRNAAGRKEGWRKDARRRFPLQKERAQNEPHRKRPPHGRTLPRIRGTKQPCFAVRLRMRAALYLRFASRAYFVPPFSQFRPALYLRRSTKRASFVNRLCSLEPNRPYCRGISLRTFERCGTLWETPYGCGTSGSRS